jgi:hypothetical protein
MSKTVAMFGKGREKTGRTLYSMGIYDDRNLTQSGYESAAGTFCLIGGPAEAIYSGL